MQDRSLPRVYFSNAPVAQLVEHLTEDQGVVGSIPSGSTKFYSCVYGDPKDSLHSQTQAIKSDVRSSTNLVSVSDLC